MIAPVLYAEGGRRDRGAHRALPPARRRCRVVRHAAWSALKALVLLAIATGLGAFAAVLVAGRWPW